MLAPQRLPESLRQLKPEQSAPPASDDNSGPATASAWPLRAIPLGAPTLQLSVEDCITMERHVRAGSSSGLIRLLPGEKCVIELPAGYAGSHSSWQAPVLLATPRAARVASVDMVDEHGTAVALSSAGGDAAAAGAATTVTVTARDPGSVELALFCRQPWAPASNSLAPPTLTVRFEVGSAGVSAALQGVLTCCDDAARALKQWRAVWDALESSGGDADSVSASAAAKAATSSIDNLLTLQQLSSHPYFRTHNTGDDDAVVEGFQKAFL